MAQSVERVPLTLSLYLNDKQLFWKEGREKEKGRKKEERGGEGRIPILEEDGGINSSTNAAIQQKKQRHEKTAQRASTDIRAIFKPPPRSLAHSLTDVLLPCLIPSLSHPLGLPPLTLPQHLLQELLKAQRHKAVPIVIIPLKRIRHPLQTDARLHKQIK